MLEHSGNVNPEVGVLVKGGKKRKDRNSIICFSQKAKALKMALQ